MDRWKKVNGLEVSSFRPQWRTRRLCEAKSFNLISITWYKDLSTSRCSGRDDDHSIGVRQW